MENSEDNLLEWISRDATGCYEYIVARYSNYVRGVFRSFRFEDNVCDDLSQEVFLRVWKALLTYRPTGKLSGWTGTIAANVAKDELKRMAIRRESEDRLIKHLTEVMASKRRGSEIEPELLRRALKAALAGLGEQERKALLLRVERGLPYKEIAEMLGLTLGGVCSAIHNARTKVLEELARYIRNE